MNMYYMSGWVWIVGGILFLAFWGGVIALIVWAVRRLTEGKAASGSNPLDIAKERYARGEITKEQFDQIKRDLS